MKEKLTKTVSKRENSLAKGGIRLTDKVREKKELRRKRKIITI